MFGITDYGAFCATIVLVLVLVLALPGPGTFALLTSTGKGGFRGGAVAAKVKANRTAARWLERAAGVFLIGFGLRLVRD